MDGGARNCVLNLDVLREGTRTAITCRIFEEIWAEVILLPLAPIARAANTNTKACDSVSYFNALYFTAHNRGFTHEFVSHNLARLYIKSCLVTMYIGATYATRMNLNQYICRSNIWYGYMFYGDVSRSLVHCRFHCICHRGVSSHFWSCLR